MFKTPRWWALLLLAAIMSSLLPAATLAAPAAQSGKPYGGSIVQTFNNCGLTQIFGTVKDAAGNPKNGVGIRLWWADAEVRTTSGSKPDVGAAGWDFSLDTRAVANTWYVAVEDASGTLLSDPVAVTTSSACNTGDVNVVKMEFREGGSAPAPTPAPGPSPAPGPGGGSSPMEPAPPIAPGATCKFYTEAGAGQGGFAVCDDVNARFLTTFNQYGLQRVGYPISHRFKRDGFITQAFQKAIFQWRPDGNYVAFVNVFDELHNAGYDQTLLERRQTPFQLNPSFDAGLTFQQAVAKRQALLNVRPALRSAYFSVSNPLLFYGLPTSEVKDMGNHYAVRMQRGVLQEWKENVPWARAGQVTVANGADIAKELGHLAGAALVPEAAPPSGGGGATPPPPPPTTGFGYGIQAHMIYESRAPIYSATRDLGFGWLKQQIEWKVWEQNPGNISWGEMDVIVNEANANGIKMLFSVVGAPGWAREPGYDANVAGPPQNPQTFANFLGAVAGRYCGKGVGAIEVWNEQNLHYEWGNKPISPAEYMALLKPSYGAIKAACPSMIVVAGALTPTGAPAPLAMDDFAYLQGMYANGLKQYADVIGMHPSGFNVPPTLDHTQACAYLRQTNSSFMGPCNAVHHSWSFKSTVDGYRNIMVQNGDSAKKLWATEFGWAAGGAYHPDYGYANDNTFQEQADWTVQAYQYMRNSGFVGAAFLWNLNFRVVADGTEKAQWGIVTNAWQPLPAYGALKAMAK